MERANPLMQEVTMCKGAYAAIEGADVVVIVTESDAICALNLERVNSLAKSLI